MGDQSGKLKVARETINFCKTLRVNLHLLQLLKNLMCQSPLITSFGEPLTCQGSKLATNWSHMRLDFGCAPKNSCVIAPVCHKTQSTVRLTYFRLYLRTWTRRRCMFNWSFLPMDSTNSNVLFRFDVLLHPRLFCFVINTTDTCKYMLWTKHVLFAQWTIMSNI